MNFLPCPKIGVHLRRIIANPYNLIFVSAVTGWEIAIKKSIGKLTAPDDIDRIVSERGFIELPVRIHHASTLLKLPFYHRDPFDRMLIAQAIAEDLTIITADKKFRKYGVRLLEIS